MRPIFFFGHLEFESYNITSFIGKNELQEYMHHNEIEV